MEFLLTPRLHLLRRGSPSLSVMEDIWRTGTGTPKAKPLAGRLLALPYPLGPQEGKGLRRPADFQVGQCPASGATTATSGVAVGWAWEHCHKSPHTALLGWQIAVGECFSFQSRCRDLQAIVTEETTLPHPPSIASSWAQVSCLMSLLWSLPAMVVTHQMWTSASKERSCPCLGPVPTLHSSHKQCGGMCWEVFKNICFLR